MTNIRQISTTVKTGDTITINGQDVTIGIIRKIDGKNKIALHYKINETSSFTEFVTTLKLNKLLKLNNL